MQPERLLLKWAITAGQVLECRAVSALPSHPTPQPAPTPAKPTPAQMRSCAAHSCWGVSRDSLALRPGASSGPDEPAKCTAHIHSAERQIGQPGTWCITAHLGQSFEKKAGPDAWKQLSRPQLRSSPSALGACPHSFAESFRKTQFLRTRYHSPEETLL